MKINFAILTILGQTLCLLVSAAAQHPIDVQRKTADGAYYDAVVLYEKMPKRRVDTETLLAAGKSEWAIGLSEQAIQHYDEVLRSDKLPEVERGRALISRGTIDFQEGRFEVASLYAQKAVNTLTTSSPLRSTAWALWGQALGAQGNYGTAEEKYQKAIEETSPENAAELHFLLGQSKMKLGKADQAREEFEKVPLHHDRTPQAIRNLAQIALDSGKFDVASFWLQKGRDEFQDSFLDSWVDYALLQVAAHEGKLDEMEAIQKRAIEKYPPSDYWLTLLNASAEAYQWQSH